MNTSQPWIKSSFFANTTINFQMINRCCSGTSLYSGVMCKECGVAGYYHVRTLFKSRHIYFAL